MKIPFLFKLFSGDFIIALVSGRLAKLSGIIRSPRIFSVISVLFFLCFPFFSYAQFPYQETFRGTTATGVVFGGDPNSAYLTADTGYPKNEVNDADGQGYLRLTNEEGNQTGFVYSDRVFLGTYGLDIEFEYSTYGGDGADGICFFLFDAAVSIADFKIGGFGGSLGYAQLNGSPGVTGGYLGIGLDEYGNFSNSDETRKTGIANPDNGRLSPDRVVLRGSGNGYLDDVSNYEYLTSTKTSFPLAGGVRGAAVGQTGYRKLIINLKPRPGGGLIINVSIKHDGVATPTPVIVNYNYTTPIPAQGLKYGVSSSTGGSTNYHEIRGLSLTVDPNALTDPTANDDLRTICQNNSINIPILDNDIKPNANGAVNLQTVDLDPTTIPVEQELIIPDEGTYTFSQTTGELRFVPLPAFYGISTVKYKFMDIYGAKSNIATVTINTVLPVITAQPQIPVVCEGSDFNSSVTVDVGGGASSVSYQWQYLDGGTWKPITGATGSSLTVNNVSLLDNGKQYKVIITSSGGCSIESIPATLTVNPKATVAKPADQTLCNTVSTTAVNFTGNVNGTPAGTIYNWTNDTPAIGLGASGTGDILSFTATNTGNTQLVAHITVTPTLPSGCTGTPETFTITVNPTATVAKPADQTLCNTVSTTAVNFTGNVNGTPAGTIYNWTNDTPAIGLGASGTGDILSFTATNTGNTQLVAHITVTPTLPSGCNGTAETFTITVNPTATVAKPADQTLCNTVNTTAVNFTGNVNGTPTGTIYNWTNDTPAIGLGASGTGNILSFTATNTGTTQLIAHITVTPTLPSGCTGTAETFTITVNPTATVAKPADQTLCNTVSTIAVNFTGNVNGTPAGTIYNWTNDTPAIGLGASGTGNILSFTATNTGTTQLIAHITVTPTLPSGCTGTAETFTITVNPTATVAKPADQTLCNTVSTIAVNFTGNVNGTPAGTIYNWTNDNTSIGLANSGTGDILSFTATNTGTTQLVAHITVTPTLPSGCNGTPETFTITVNPTATVAKPADQTLCNTVSTTAVNFTGNVNGTPAGTIYNWTNDTPAIGLGASGTGDILSFTATNTGTTQLVAHITVTPTLPSGCNGTPETFTITVNPTATVAKPADQTLCNTVSTIAVNFTGNVNGTPAGTIYNWTNDTPAIGLGASGTGNILSFTATNTGTTQLVAHITVTPTLPSGCTGTPETFTITVNPTATVAKPADQTLCNTVSTIAVNFTGNVNGTPAGTIYNWTNDNTSIGLANSGIGDILSFTATNTGTTQLVAHITVTPTLPSGCNGTAETFTITVNPTATVAKPADQTLCNTVSTTAVNFTGNVNGTPAGTIYNWTNDTPAIGLGASGTGDILSFTATNTGTTQLVAHITVTPTLPSGCNGTSETFTITVNPTATVAKPADQTLCNTVSTTAVNFTGNVNGTPAGTIYNWTNDTPAIGLGASGTGDILSFTATNTGTTQLVAHITVTPTLPSGCNGTSETFTITVNPTATVAKPADQTLCNTVSTIAVNFTGNVNGTPAGTIYNWTNDTPAIGLGASGTGNILSFTATNTGTTQLVAHITVTPTLPSGCNGTAETFTITVNPTATVAKPADQTLCNTVSTTAVNFTGNVNGTPAGTIYNWTNNTPAIGLEASGTGDILSFTATNTGTTQLIAHITVTPTLPSGCTGTPETFTITVNPTATVAKPADQTLCNTVSTTAVNFTGNVNGTPAGTIYNWTNDTPAIGLGALGTGDILSFTATNTGTTQLVAHITVIPTLPSGCNGTPETFTITVNPTATVAKPADQTLCNTVSTTAVNFTGNVNGTPAGTIYNWTNDNTSIGLANSGTGDILSFTATNTGITQLVAHITVTPTLLSGCNGTAETFTITVNPTATVAKPADQTLCNTVSTTAVNFTGNVNGTPAGTIYNWTNDNTSIGLANSGTGNILSFTATNTGTTQLVAHITVTPTLPSGCNGTPETFTITVNPTATVAKPADQTLCNTVNTTAVNFTGNVNGTPAGTIYNWTNDNTSIGLANSGIGDILSFTATNTGTTQLVAHITVTPTLPSGCTGTPETFTITVNPTATVAKPADQTLCNTVSTIAVNFTGNVNGTPAGTIYNWTNDNTSIGLANSGIGDILSFTATNTGTTQLVAHIIVTPTLPSGCTGTPETFTITVNPTATVAKPADQTLCNTVSTTAVNFTGNVNGTPAGTIYNWTNDNTSIGLANSGIGDILSFTATNTGTTQLVAHITITPTLPSGCNGTPETFTITVNPTATVAKPADQTLCNTVSTTAVNFTGNVNGTPTGTIYNWTNDTPAIGLGASGTGDILSFTATNTGTTQLVAHITVTPTLPSGCNGTSETFTITVNPTATVAKPADQTLCNTVSTTAVNFTGNVNGTPTGTIYNWTNDTPAIGLGASGTGDILSFTATNTGTTQLVAHITVTPTLLSGCNGTPETFTITVNPTATVAKPADQTLCNTVSTTAVNFTGNVNGTPAGTIYNWTNDNTSIGLANSGIGDILSFTATNTGNTQLVAHITVTPTLPSGCTGTPETFTITVNPTATVAKPADQTLCNTVSTTAVNFTGNVNGTPAGTIYNWTNDTPAIGLGASGTGDILSFTATNTGNTQLVAHITVTPTLPSGCNGTAETFTITVNPTATVAKPADQTLCNTVNTTAVNFTGNVNGTPAGTIYNWTNDTPAIGLGASGTGDILSFTATNTGNTQLVAHITVTPILPSGCNGTAETFTITVNPTATVAKPADQTLCNTVNTTAVNFTGNVNGTPAGTIYNWTNDTPAIGLGASGTGNILSFTATNTGTTQLIAHITVTPTLPSGCTGTAETFTITVNPTATVAKPADQTLCNTVSTIAVNFTGNVNGTPAGTIYNWTNDNTSIGLANSGTGDILSFTATNTGTTQLVAHITVTPTLPSGCNGTAETFTITVNPTATVAKPADQTLCNTVNTTAVNFTGNVNGTPAGTIYNWTNDIPAIGLGASGTGNILSFTATNTGTTQLVAHITVTPTLPSGCTGTPETFTITVNPTATVAKPADQTLCNTVSTTAVNFTGNVNGTPAGTIYNWTNDNTSIGLANSGIGDILSFTATNTGTTQLVAHITVTPTLPSGCTGTPETFTITVNPTATVAKPADQTLCNTVSTTAVNFTGNVNGTPAGTIYNWTNDNTSIGLANSGIGDILSFTATNTGTTQLVAHITVTPTLPSGCNGTPETFTITVNPTATVAKPADQTLCNTVSTIAVNFTGNVNGTPAGTIYNWTNDTPAIGLGASGTGNILSFTATNTGTTQLVAHITVTPTLPSGCTGTPETFTITVNPTATVAKPADQTLCNTVSTIAVNFTGNVNGTPAGTIYNWTNDNTSIGLANSGTGNILSFTATNTGTTQLVAHITVTPILPSGCNGTPETFTITVNPTATVAKPADQVKCSGTLTNAITFSGTTANTLYSWTNNHPEIGLPSSGTSNGIPAFTGINNGNTPIVATIAITPVTTAGCPGVPKSFTITINPKPTGFDDLIDNLTCENNTISYNLQNNVNNTVKGGNSVPSSFTWTVAPNNKVTGLSNGSGTTINATFTNISNQVQQIIYTVTPTALTGGCPGTPFTITVRVPVCSGLTITKTADVSVVSQAGDQIKYTITVKNTATANHTNVKVTDPFLGGILPSPATGDNGNGILEANESWVYTGTYTVKQADIDNNGKPTAATGKIINTAQVTTAEHPVPVSASSTVDIVTTGSISLVKTGVMSSDFSTITYTFKITNTGKVKLHNLKLVDTKITGNIVLSATVIEAGASVTATATYTITDNEKRDGKVLNTATATGLTPAGDQVTDISGTESNNDEPTLHIIDDAPQAFNDSGETKINQPIAILITGNDLPSFNGLDKGSIVITQYPSNGQLQIGPDGTITYTPNKGYSGPDDFRYTVTDNLGKPSNQALVNITVIPVDIFIPNTFTPNGDGKNDTFKIIGRESYDTTDLLIFNRWGNEVYRSKNYLDEWNGSGLSEGTYYYLIVFKKGADQVTKKGWILLKR